VCEQLAQGWYLEADQLTCVMVDHMFGSEVLLQFSSHLVFCLSYEIVV